MRTRSRGALMPGSGRQARLALVTVTVGLVGCGGGDRPPVDGASPCTYGPAETALRVENRLFPELEHADTGVGTVDGVDPLRIEQGSLTIEVEPAPAVGLLAPGQEVELFLYGVCTGSCQYYLRLSEPEPPGSGDFLAAAWVGAPPPSSIVPGVELRYERADCPLTQETCATDVTPLVLTATAADGTEIEIGPQREAPAFGGYRIVNGHSRVARAVTCPNQRTVLHAGVVYPLP